MTTSPPAENRIFTSFSDGRHTQPQNIGHCLLRAALQHNTMSTQFCHAHTHRHTHVTRSRAQRILAHNNFANHTFVTQNRTCAMHTPLLTLSSLAMRPLSLLLSRLPHLLVHTCFPIFSSFLSSRPAVTGGVCSSKESNSKLCCGKAPA